MKFYTLFSMVKIISKISDMRVKISLQHSRFWCGHATLLPTNGDFDSTYPSPVHATLGRAGALDIWHSCSKFQHRSEKGLSVGLREKDVS